MLKHHILYDFKRRKKAQIVDKEYSYSGDLVKTIIKTAQRKPKQKWLKSNGIGAPQKKV